MFFPREVSLSRCANEGENLDQCGNQITFCDQASLCFSLEKDGGQLCFEGYDEGKDLRVLCPNTRVSLLLVLLSLRTGTKVRSRIQKWKQTIHIALGKKNPTCKQKLVFCNVISTVCFLSLFPSVCKHQQVKKNAIHAVVYLPYPFHSCWPPFPTNTATPPCCHVLPHSVLLTVPTGDEQLLHIR